MRAGALARRGAPAAVMLEQRVRAALHAMRRLGLAQLDIRIGRERVKVHRTQAADAPRVVARQAAPASLPPSEVVAEPAGHAVRAALAGAFYAAPRPGAPPFVKAGDLVDLGTVLGLIEAMKVFNEVNADRAGRVLRILVHSGDVVAAGAPLVILDVADNLAGRTAQREGV